MITPGDWLLRLKTAYEAGYYRTEASLSEQTPFPWQNKTCSHCPFWTRGTCMVHREYRHAAAHTCTYFDPARHDAARRMIAQDNARAFDQWWEEFNRRQPRR